MQQFEIKIFANPSGFQELKLNNSDNLFTKEIVEKRNFDGDYGTFKDGTFSVLFTPKAFIIDYIFNVVADAGFRDPQTHIAIAIERGYILKDAYQVFTNLRKEFNLIAAEYKVNIARSLYNKSETLNKIVEDNIEFAPDQFRISTSEIDVTKRALASYETEEQLNSLLEEPNRPKFRSYSLVYFLKKIDASELYKKESIKKYYSGIVMDDSDFNFHASYEVIFPDNHSITITSKSELIDYTCSKMYYKSERFYGTLNEHMQDWEVSQSEDRTKFIIGKKLIPETKELQIACYDTQNNLIATPKSLEFSLGKFSAQRSILLLIGEDIDKSFVCSSTDDRIKPEYIGRKGDVIAFKIIRHFFYDISAVFRYAYNTTEEEIEEIKIYQKNNRKPLFSLTKPKTSFYAELTPDKLEYEIPETKKYYSTRGGFGSECQPLKPSKIQKKDTADVELIIKNDTIIRTLNQKVVTCYYKTAHDKKQEDKYPRSSDFNEDGHLVIKELPLGEFSYKIKISGYKEIKKELTLYQKEKSRPIELTFERTTWNKAKNILNKYKGSVAIFGIGLAFGGFLHPYVFKEKPEIVDYKIELKAVKDSLESIINRLENDSIPKLNERISELKAEITENKDAAGKASQLASGSNNLASGSNNLASGSNNKHPQIISKIIHLTKNDNYKKSELTKQGTAAYNALYNKLSDKEKKDVDRLINTKGYDTIDIPANGLIDGKQEAINTIDVAIKYLNSRNDDN